MAISVYVLCATCLAVGSGAAYRENTAEIALDVDAKYKYAYPMNAVVAQLHSDRLLPLTHSLFIVAFAHNCCCVLRKILGIYFS